MKNAILRYFVYARSLKSKIFGLCFCLFFVLSVFSGLTGVALADPGIKYAVVVGCEDYEPNGDWDSWADDPAGTLGVYNLGVDEVWLDRDNSGNVTAVDQNLYAGSTPGTAPVGTPLIPLIDEDPKDGVDNDKDGKIDEDYPGSEDVTCANNDAEEMANLLKGKGWTIYDPKKQGYLKDATQSEIMAGLEWLTIAKKCDYVLFYFSGHGFNLTDEKPLDEADNRDEYLKGTDHYGISDDNLKAKIRDDIKSEHVAVILDCCYSGGFLEVVRDGCLVLTSSKENQTSLHWNDTWCHGVFTHFLLDELGAAPKTYFLEVAFNRMTTPDDKVDKCVFKPGERGHQNPQKRDYYLTAADSTVNYDIAKKHSPPYIESSDATGKRCDQFKIGQKIYVYGVGLNPAPNNGKVYIVDDADWTPKDYGKKISVISHINFTKENVGASGGKFLPKDPLELCLVEKLSGTYPDHYDIVYDVNGNGIYEAGDLVDEEICTGFTTIPEFTTIVIPVAAILGLLFLFSRRKRKV